MSNAKSTSQEFQLAFDDATYDRLNESTIESYDGTLEEIAASDPNNALRLLHTVLDRQPSVVARDIAMQASVFVLSSTMDGMFVARAGFLHQIDDGFMGGNYTHPAVVTIDVVQPRRLTQVISRSARRRLMQPETRLTIAVEPPSYAM